MSTPDKNIGLTENSALQVPLAERLRPRRIEQVVGQEHLIGNGKPLSKLLEAKWLPSIIFWGPPGVGKTTLAKVLANTIEKAYFELSAINAGVKEIRAVIEEAKALKGAVLFIDEIHRFSKSQQDSLLKAVEEGTITLIGATTENPSFEVNSALLSRCRVFSLKELSYDNLKDLLAIALASDVFLKDMHIKIEEYSALIQYSGGDARVLLNLLEIVVEANGFSSNETLIITDALVQETVSKNLLLYDKAGEQHYNIISAFIKSIRGSDPNAAVYYLARMLVSGEDPIFIARRLLISAAEDIGIANPNALLLAEATMKSCERLGMPECRIALSECAIYLASSPKSNRSYVAINEAMSLVKKTGNLSIPLHLRNAPTQLMKNEGYGKEYKYAHDFEGNFIEQEFLPEEIKGTKLYEPGNTAREEELRKYLRGLWQEKYNY